MFDLLIKVLRDGIAIESSISEFLSLPEESDNPREQDHGEFIVFDDSLVVFD